MHAGAPVIAATVGAAAAALLLARVFLSAKAAAPAPAAAPPPPETAAAETQTRGFDDDAAEQDRAAALAQGDWAAGGGAEVPAEAEDVPPWEVSEAEAREMQQRRVRIRQCETSSAASDLHRAADVTGALRALALPSFRACELSSVCWRRALVSGCGSGAPLFWRPDNGAPVQVWAEQQRIAQELSLIHI